MHARQCVRPDTAVPVDGIERKRGEGGVRVGRAHGGRDNTDERQHAQADLIVREGYMKRDI
jgi:hypothetical protein